MRAVALTKGVDGDSVAFRTFFASQFWAVNFSFSILKHCCFCWFCAKRKREKHSSKSIGLIAVVMLVSHENTVTVITKDDKCTFFYFRHRRSIIFPFMRDVPHKTYNVCIYALHLFAFEMETRNSSFSKHEEMELCSPFNTFYRNHKENQKAKHK